MSEFMKVGKDGESWIIDLFGKEVTQCRFDQAFSLDVYRPEGDFLIVIENEFCLRRAGAEDTVLNPQGDPISMAPALRMLGAGIDRVTANSDGQLLVEFVGGNELFVDANECFEAWHVTASNGLRLVSLPGGGLAEWAPR